MKLRLAFFLVFLILKQTFSQSKPKKLGPALNVHSFNYTAPFISLDGNSLIFLYDYTDDGSPALFLSTRQGGNWKEPIAVPKRLTSLSYAKAGTLSPDGKTLFITSQKGGLGGYDIWYATISGGAFSEPMPLGAPVNSALHEGSPSISADGSTLYFMRCTKMNTTSADECKIFVSKKDNRNQWGPPTELPPSINTGNSQMPRIMADGETLLFASNKLTPSKGGHDVYLTRLSNGQWSAPVQVETVNTAGDDLFYSATYQGANIVRDWPGDNKSELVEIPFPATVKPRASTRVVGNVTGVTDAAKANIRVIDLSTGSVLSSSRPDARGEFIAYVPEGKECGLFVDPPMENMSYWFKNYDYRNGRIPLVDRVNTSLRTLAPGDEIVLEGVRFKQYSSELDPASNAVLQRVAKMIWGNLALQFEINVTLFGWQQDSIPQADLTETRPDTVVYEMEYQVDSVTTETRDSIAIETIYHNDRTAKQGQAIARFLQTQAVKPDRISFSYKVLEEAVVEKRRVVVTLRTK